MALTAGFLVNVSSARNKTDELQANVRRLHEYRGPSEPCFTFWECRRAQIPPSIISCGPPPTLKKTAKRLQSYDFAKQSSFTFHTSSSYLDFLILEFRCPPPSQLQPPQYRGGCKQPKQHFRTLNPCRAFSTDSANPPRLRQ